MIDLNASTAALDAIGEPTDADLAGVEAPVAESVEDWAALLDAEVGAAAPKKVDEDFWNVDENVHDDRYDSGIPSWSAWA